MVTSTRFNPFILCGVCVIATLSSALADAPVTVPVTESAIVWQPSEPEPGISAKTAALQNERLQKAAEELQKHLALVTGVTLPLVSDGKRPADVAYVFRIGHLPPEAEPLAEQEVRWEVGAEATTLYGEGAYGDLYAVYSFLEDQLGIHWIAPGDDGIVYQTQLPLVLRSGAYNWIPELRYRSIRLGNARVADKVYQPDNKFADFYPDLEAHNAFAQDAWDWQMRLRMYGSRPGGAHTFSSWWKKYGATHPEYFALNRFGKREPVPLPKGKERSEAFIKICASNREVAQQIIDDWLPQKDRQQFLSVGVNDGNSNFCECEDCLALDEPREGEAWDAHLTDRYVVLANRVMRMAREHRPDVYVTIYAYLSTLYPPRRVKLEPNIVVQLVPYVDPLDLETVRAHFQGWKEAGATKLMLRPNYHHKYLTTAMPTGVEKQMFDVFQLAYQNGCFATDYDSLRHQWAVTGITDYILAKSFMYPEKPFEYWAEEYYSAFGAAAPEVRRYYEYWRQEVWEKRLQPNIMTICDLGGAGDFDRGLFWSLGTYYSPADFEQARAFLEQAAKRDLEPDAARRVRQLQLVNEHARLTYLAVVAEPYNKPDHAEQLLAFRQAHRDDLQLSWKDIIGFEKGNGDLTGMMISEEMQGYLKPWLQTELFWRFQLDQEDVGRQEMWHQKSWDQTADWHRLRTDRTWENQFAADEPSNLPEDVSRIITTYDGIGWYSTRIAVPEAWQGRQILLRFGAVDESCWIYVNGELAGEHLYQDTNDWKTPFEIPISDHIVWDAPLQMVTVRVEDKSGLGGVWRPVWLVSKAAE